MRKSDGVKVTIRRSNGVRVQHDKKQDRVRVHHEKG